MDFVPVAPGTATLIQIAPDFWRGIGDEGKEGEKFFNEKTVELYALGACMLTIAGMDTGSRYEYLARQLYEMHRDSEQSFDEVYGQFEKAVVREDENGILRVREWKHHWSSAMSRDGQILHATFFPRHIPQEVYYRITSTTKPSLRDSDWPTVEGKTNPLQERMLHAEKRCAQSFMPERGIRSRPLMALINCTIRPITFLL